MRMIRVDHGGYAFRWAGGDFIAVWRSTRANEHVPDDVIAFPSTIKRSQATGELIEQVATAYVAEVTARAGALKAAAVAVDLADVVSVLALRRTLMGISKAEIARRIRVSPGYVSRLESGDRTAPVSVLNDWAQALGVRLRVALEEETDAARP